MTVTLKSHNNNKKTQTTVLIFADLNSLIQSQYDKQMYTMMSRSCTFWILIRLNQQQFLKSKEYTSIKMRCVTKLKHEQIKARL